jgi:hypothetical protein
MGSRMSLQSAAEAIRIRNTRQWFLQGCTQAALKLAARAPLREEWIVKPDRPRRNLRQNWEVRQNLSPLIRILFF